MVMINTSYYVTQLYKVFEFSRSSYMDFIWGRKVKAKNIILTDIMHFLMTKLHLKVVVDNKWILYFRVQFYVLNCWMWCDNMVRIYISRLHDFHICWDKKMPLDNILTLLSYFLGEM
jgi:hypothetical protein